jgi:hypothetical protein
MTLQLLHFWISLYMRKIGFSFLSVHNGWLWPTWVANLAHDQEETPDHGPDVDVVEAHQEEDQVVYVELDKDAAKQKQKNIDYSFLAKFGTFLYISSWLFIVRLILSTF